MVMELASLSIKLPTYSEKLYTQGLSLFDHIQTLYVKLPPDLSQAIAGGLATVLHSLTSVLGRLLSSSFILLSKLPSLLLFLLVMIISTFFIARDKQMILHFFKTQMSNSLRTKGKIVKQDLLSAFLGYIRAQLILMSITFVESAIGLSLIGIDYALLLALFASIIDALPVLGTGAVYIPLIIWSLLSGKYATAASLATLYAVIIIVRQLLEPKILGNQIGLYPLATLMSMYIGLKIFGIIGLIIGPVALIALTTLQKIDVLPRWKE